AGVEISAEEASSWREGAYEVWHLRRGVKVRQAHTRATSDEAICWVLRSTNREEPSRVIAYFEGNVQVDELRGGDAHATSGAAAQTYRDAKWFSRFETRDRIELSVPLSGRVTETRPPIYRRGLEARSGTQQRDESVKPAQFTGTPEAGLPPAIGSAGTE